MSRGRHATVPTAGLISLRWDGAPRGTTAIEAGIAVALLGIIIALSWGWQGSITRRRVQNASYLLEGDLRLTQQTAVTTSGNGPQAELCFRSNGYDIYTVVYQDPVNRTTPVAGGIVKTANQGQEYAKGIQITADSSNATNACTADGTRSAIVFLASGAPKFGDTNSHKFAVALGGQSLNVTVQPTTGLTTVGP